jgi:hypothetical protein
MAEIALILGSLGAAYIASNRNNDQAKEGYRNENASNSRYLPNMNIPTTNYPIIRPNTGSNVNEYKNPNTPTDRYYASNVDFDKMSAGVAGGVGGVGILRGIAERGRNFANDGKDIIPMASSVSGTVGEGLDTQFGDNYSKDGFTSLMGSQIDPRTFTHNNMEPYYGAKIRGTTTGANMHENVLDNKIGGGSQYFSKTEQAPLFRPQDNIHNPNGMPKPE